MRLGAMCFLLFPLLFMGQPSAGQTGETDERAIRAVMDRFVDAWNHHDAKAFATVFAEDADFTNWRGTGASGRSKIEAFHAPFLPRFSAKATWNIRISRRGSSAPTLPPWMCIGK